jgi:Fic family protein
VVDSGRLIDVLSAPWQEPSGTYLHWDDVLRRPRPDGFTHEEWWVGLKYGRFTQQRPIPLVGKGKRPFFYLLPDPIPERLQQIDRDASGGLLFPEEAVSREHRNRYVVSSLVEEAITSSQLEGAATTRRVAKEMIRSGRAPLDKDERMILNNYHAMQWIRTRTDQPLTPGMVLDLHRLLGEGALDAGEPGVLRGPDPNDEFGVWSNGQRLYRPPDSAELPERLERMCAFANGEGGGTFIHPVLKAVTLHFWLAYDHPFEDGNGRTARALFYWYLLREGYWLFEFVSISRVLKKSYARYARAYLYTESDDNDLTYFFLFHLDVIHQSIGEVQDYLRRKVREMQQAKALLQPGAGLNHRQLALLRHAMRHPGQQYTIASHRTSHAVTNETARTDLVALADRGLLVRERRSRKFVFSAPHDLDGRLQTLNQVV